jgi:hypothetical protein
MKTIKALMDGWNQVIVKKHHFQYRFVRADGSVVAMEQAIPERNIK